MTSFLKFLGGLAAIGLLSIWLSNRPQNHQDGEYQDSSDSIFSYSATIHAAQAVLAPDQLKCTMESNFADSDKVSWMKHMADPNGAREAEKRNRRERLRRAGCRELEMGTKIRVVETGRGYCRVRVSGEEDTWWMLERDLRRDL